MSRTVTLSTAVFAAIWANRRDGEETEDAILRRLLNCGSGAATSGVPGEREGGVYDTRNEVNFPEGFKIFRSYKRREYKAIAREGVWIREDTGQPFPALNQLNQSIVSGNENVWKSWKYHMPDGSERSIDSLRG